MTMLARLPLVLLLSLGVSLPAFAQTAFEDPSGGGSASGSLVAVEPEVALDNVALSSSSQAIVRFRNDAAQAITFGEMNIYPSSNISVATTLNQCEQNPLPFGGECAIVMSVKALKPGPFQAQLLIQHSGRSKLITASITGTVDQAAAGQEESSGEVQASPATVDYATVETSYPTLRTVQLRNTSSDPLTISSIDLESPQKANFKVGGECKDMQPGQSCLVSLIWSPQIAGPISGFLVVNHSGTSKITNIPIQGEYRPGTVTDLGEYPQPVAGKGLLMASAKEVAFGEEVDSESAQTITLANAGDTDLELRGLSLSVVTSGLSIDPSGCRTGLVIKPSEACPLTLRWSPQKLGNLTTDLRISHNGTRGIMVIPVKGKATGIAKGSMGFSAVVPVPPSTAAETATGNTVGISTDLPGSAGLTLDDIDELSAALDGDFSDVISRTASGAPAAGTRSYDPIASKADAAANTLSTYIVTSHSINRAVVMGQGVTHIVTHNKPIMLEGVKWTPAIKPDGVDLSASGKTVRLAFDAALAANQNLLTDNSEIATEGSTMAAPTSEQTAMQAAAASSNNVVVPAAQPLPAIAPTPAPTEDGDTGLPDIFAQ